MPRTLAYPFAAITFGLGFVLALLSAPYLPGPGGNLIQLNESLKQENEIQRKLIESQNDQLRLIKAVWEKSENNEDQK